LNPESNGAKLIDDSCDPGVEFLTGLLVEPVQGLIRDAYQSLKLHAAKDYPNEAVGIICDGGFIHPLINQARSPHRYEVSKQLVVEAFETITSRGLVPIGFYHSHPSSTPEPSPRDVLHMSEYPNTLFIIIGPTSISAWIASISHPDYPDIKPDHSAINHIAEVTDVEYSEHGRT